MPGNEVRKLRRASCQGNRRAVPRLAHVTRGELRSKHTGEPTVTRIIRRAEVVERTGLSESSIQRRLKSGEFPSPLRLGGPNSRSVGWREEDIDAWLEDLEEIDY